jgi:regulator of sigma E protease
LTPLEWLKVNSTYLVALVVLAGMLVYFQGWEGLWNAALLVLGLGFVIFIHELGHFLMAKWCDVHVQTFSIGFGPALPGCSFKRGETTYKIGVLPLGGYVNMVGEGPEADEDENYPRSFKNKTVGQRMLIISAGVVMNVISGAALLAFVYAYHGVERPPAEVGQVDPGSPAWVSGLRPGDVITRIGDDPHPDYESLLFTVMVSRPDEKISFVTQAPGGAAPRTVDLVPRKDENDPKPVIGVLPADKLELTPPKYKKLVPFVVRPGSPAAAARPLGLRPGDVVLATTDPDHPDQLKDLPPDPLSRRLLRLAGKPMTLEVQRLDAFGNKGVIEQIEVPLEGFTYGDRILGCTQWNQPEAVYNPFLVAALPHDERHAADPEARDPFVFHEWMRRLAGKPVVIRVRRFGAGDSDAPVDLFVPAAFHQSPGLRMQMGKVAALRDQSPAAKAGINAGDVLSKVTMTDADGQKLLERTDLDPVRLPSELARAAAKSAGPKKVTVTVLRQNLNTHEAKDPTTLHAMDWDESWDFSNEPPLSLASPLSIPQLGIAYWATSIIAAVPKDSPADQAGLQANDTITEIRFKKLDPKGGDPSWGEWWELQSKRDSEKVNDEWAAVFERLQEPPYHEVQVKFKRGSDEMGPTDLGLSEDTDWPLTDRGLSLFKDERLHKADSLGEGLVMGLRDTKIWIVRIYLQIRSLITGRLSTKQLSGPIGILSAGFSIAGLDSWKFLWFLGVISINLAVVNFLPIPVLDGGHMVFLIYEKLRGRRPSEAVYAIANWAGILALLLLLVFVTFQDIKRFF